MQLRPCTGWWCLVVLGVVSGGLACSSSSSRTPVASGAATTGTAAAATATTRPAVPLSTSTTGEPAVIGTTEDLGCRYLSADEVATATGAKVANAIPGGNPSLQLFPDLPSFALSTCQWQTEQLAGWNAGLLIDMRVRKFPDAATSVQFTKRMGAKAGPALGDASSENGPLNVFVATRDVSVELQFGNGPTDPNTLVNIANQAIPQLVPHILARVDGTEPLAPPPAGSTTAGAPVSITDQQIDEYQRAYGGTWSGSWRDATFGTSGSITATLAFDKAAKTVASDLRIAGNIIGGHSGIAELKRTLPLTSVVGVLRYTDPTATVAWRFQGNGTGITVTVTKLAGHPDVNSIQLSAHLDQSSSARANGTIFVSFTNNTTANGSWTMVKS
jgi:hypothetical protein